MSETAETAETTKTAGTVEATMSDRGRHGRSSHVDVPIRWIDDATPQRLPAGATFGAPVPRGAVASPEGLALTDEAGAPVPAQIWPLATWPDGSVKWAGIGLGVHPEPSPSYRLVAAASSGAVEESGAGRNTGGGNVAVVVAQDPDGVTIETGALTARIPARGGVLVDSLAIAGQEVARGGVLVSSVQGTPEPNHAGRDHGIGQVESVEVEQSGPVRAVVRIEGRHRTESGREWLPFTVRLVAVAGSTHLRLVHSFIWDGDSGSDFLSSLGIRFDVPLRAEPHDRHVRLAGADGGLLREAVRGLTGLRRDPGEAVRNAQMAGEPTPSADTWDQDVARLAAWIPTWDDWNLRQHNANGYTIRKRTKPGHAWIGVAEGTRSDGFGYLGDTGGGLGVGLTGFWQSHPTGIDISGAATAAGSITMWLWSPDAEPMDLRFYHDGLGQDTYADQLDALDITYEDYEPGFGDADGIARTHELDVVAYAATPSVEELATDVAHTVEGPRLAPTPEALHAAGVFGDWDLPDRSTPGRARLEDRLEALLDFYVGQVDQRSWYGFWNYGDLMHAYDADRHTWRYDVGGYAWDNSELSPDLWLWTAFCRTGRADVFRLAERLTRHTGDVDVYHAGQWKGLGTRHNVQHWGCSAKQLRISTPAYRRHHYFLTADEHTRDLMLELRDSDQSFLGLDPVRKVRPDAVTYRPQRHALGVGLGTDWSALAATWLADWEITGNTRSRDRLLGTMTDIGALPHGFFTGEALYDLDTGRFDTSRDRVGASHLSIMFGLVEICSELVDLIGEEEAPGFGDAWLQYCRLYLGTPEEQVAELGAEHGGAPFEQPHARVLAYAANRLGRSDLAERAWQAFFVGGERMRGDFVASRTEPPYVLAPVDDAPTLWTNDAAQGSLATMQCLALIGDHLPD
ncbi:Tat pathway signal sequence domain protein [Ruania halotolerans]|uniref:exo-rhamnogalacturonan lyase family protein n=1 Tax=Ruania halotolerans TaxID=2897773 RepID=UPI001E4BE11A|nr:Tat pathway signal sequence domain protein [Ruania halotolerans]UFU07021.1 Tat pathway signal sequence domain protein [Ruania halotolerans]